MPPGYFENPLPLLAFTAIVGQDLVLLRSAATASQSAFKLAKSRVWGDTDFEFPQSEQLRRPDKQSATAKLPTADPRASCASLRQLRHCKELGGDATRRDAAVIVMPQIPFVLREFCAQ